MVLLKKNTYMFLKNLELSQIILMLINIYFFYPELKSSTLSKETDSISFINIFYCDISIMIFFK